MVRPPSRRALDPATAGPRSTDLSPAASQTDNKASVEVFEPVHALAVEGCAVVQKVMREAMIEHTSILATLRGREAL